MTSGFLIYGLVDPRVGELRYIGLTTTGLRRPTHHWKHRHLRERHDYCHAWVRSVLKNSLVPGVIVIQSFEDVDILRDAERFWIAYFRQMGCHLTNMNDGGEGVLNPPPEVREKQRLANIGNKNGVGHKYIMSEERKKQVGDRHRGKIETFETRVKKSASAKARWKRIHDQRLFITAQP